MWRARLLVLLAPLLCAPAAGAGGVSCVTAPDGTPCDDADACTTGDQCLAGACVGGAPVAEQCWQLAGRAVARIRASGTLRGYHVRCQGKCTTTGTQLLLIDGDTYTLPSGPQECTSGSFDPTDETGSLVLDRRDRLVFEPANLDAFAADLFFCTGAHLKRLRRRMTLAPGGTESTVLETVVTRVRQQLPTRIAIKTEYAGVLGGPAPEPPPLERPLPDCENVQVRCRVD